jgi:adenosylmethionine-8-amino-7-oxononanoate aminotransferase
VNLGHARPEIIRAIKEQAGKLQHVILGGLSHEKAALLAEKLVEITPAGLSKVFFCGDGASAVEAAIRIALQYWVNAGKTGRTKFISLKDGYHGDTLGTVSVGYIQGFHREIKPALVKNYTAESPHCAACKYGQKPASCKAECFKSMEQAAEKHGKKCAAVIIEPLCQGSAGARIYPPVYLKKLRKLCDRHGLLLIADEIAVGFGRTGAMFACEKAGISPDIMTLGKGMTGGYLPMSAAVVTDSVYKSFNGKTFYYGHTFSGNPITAAAALAAIGVYEKINIAGMAAKKSKVMKQEMQETAAAFGGVYSDTLGMISMLELGKKQGGAERAKKAAAIARDLGLFVRPLGPVLYLWPPVTAGENEIRKMNKILREAALLTR